MSVSNGSHPTKKVNRNEGRPNVSAMLQNALSLQGANILQKNTLDMMATKLVLILGAVRRDQVAREDSESTAWLGRGDEIAREEADCAQRQIDAIDGFLKLTRDEARELRTNKTPDYPDEHIQKIISKAADEITAILLEHAK